MPSVHTVARRLLKDDAAADDVAQETFLAVWKSAGDFRGDASVRSWIHRIALNKARTAWRWRSIRRWISLEAPMSSEEGADTFGASLPDPALEADPAASREAADRSERLRAAVDALAPQQRETVLLRLEGLEVAEIAASLGSAVGTVKATLHQARARLESSLKEDSV